jgi:hypothetical protein
MVLAVDGHYDTLRSEAREPREERGTHSVEVHDVESIPHGMCRANGRVTDGVEVLGRERRQHHDTDAAMPGDVLTAVVRP